MSQKNVTISRTFTRDQLAKYHVHAEGRAQPYSEIHTSNFLCRQLLTAGIPVVGLVGLIAVEWGTLTIIHEDGLDGDEWTFSWTGAPVPDDWVWQAGQGGYRNKLAGDNLATRIADAEEL
jgi:hypothetical protein